MQILEVHTGNMMLKLVVLYFQQALPKNTNKCEVHSSAIFVFEILKWPISEIVELSKKMGDVKNVEYG
mgnify:CR=1 FL=1